MRLAGPASGTRRLMRPLLVAAGLGATAVCARPTAAGGRAASGCPEGAGRG